MQSEFIPRQISVNTTPVRIGVVVKASEEGGGGWLYHANKAKAAANYYYHDPVEDKVCLPAGYLHVYSPRTQLNDAIASGDPDGFVTRCEIEPGCYLGDNVQNVSKEVILDIPVSDAKQSVSSDTVYAQPAAIHFVHWGFGLQGTANNALHISQHAVGLLSIGSAIKRHREHHASENNGDDSDAKQPSRVRCTVPVCNILGKRVANLRVELKLSKEFWAAFKPDLDQKLRNDAKQRYESQVVPLLERETRFYKKGIQQDNRDPEMLHLGPWTRISCQDLRGVDLPMWSFWWTSTSPVLDYDRTELALIRLLELAKMRLQIADRIPDDATKHARRAEDVLNKRYHAMDSARQKVFHEAAQVRKDEPEVRLEHKDVLEEGQLVSVVGGMLSLLPLALVYRTDNCYGVPKDEWRAPLTCPRLDFLGLDCEDATHLMLTLVNTIQSIEDPIHPQLTQIQRFLRGYIAMPTVCKLILAHAQTWHCCLVFLDRQYVDNQTLRDGVYPPAWPGLPDDAPRLPDITGRLLPAFLVEGTEWMPTNLVGEGGPNTQPVLYRQRPLDNGLLHIKPPSEVVRNTFPYSTVAQCFTPEWIAERRVGTLTPIRIRRAEARTKAAVVSRDGVLDADMASLLRYDRHVFFVNPHGKPFSHGELAAVREQLYTHPRHRPLPNATSASGDRFQVPAPSPMSYLYLTRDIDWIGMHILDVKDQYNPRVKRALAKWQRAHQGKFSALQKSPEAALLIDMPEKVKKRVYDDDKDGKLRPSVELESVEVYTKQEAARKGYRLEAHAVQILGSITQIQVTLVNTNKT